jgi:hypothetical protein
MSARALAAGVDVGGTFTDCAAVAPDGVVRATKVLTTPEDQGIGVTAALQALGEPEGTVARLVHGTTVVTNLLLERTGARVVLCATAGATDLLELRRQDRASLYDLAVQHPAPPLPDSPSSPRPRCCRRSASTSAPRRPWPRGTRVRACNGTSNGSASVCAPRASRRRR